MFQTSGLLITQFILNLEETGRNLEDFSKRCLRKCDVSDSVEAQIEDVKYECLEKCESRRKQKSREKNAENEEIQVQPEFSQTALEIEGFQESEDEEWDLFGFSQDESERLGLISRKFMTTRRYQRC